MTRLKSVLAAFVVVVTIFVITHVAKFPGSLPYLMELNHGQKILDTQPSYSSAEIYQRLEAFGETGRQMYQRTMLTVDVIFPISAFVFFFLLARYATERLRMKKHAGIALRSLSIAYLTLDFLENVAIFIILSRFPDRLELLASCIGFVTLAKRVAMFGALLIPLLLLSIARFSGRLTVQPVEAQRTT